MNRIRPVIQLFHYYKMLGEKTFEQIDDKDLFWKYNDQSNSIAIIVKHLWGNMMSRWTDFLTTDGEKKWRDRDAEFENDLSSRIELMQKWEEGWTCLFDALSTIHEDQLDEIIYIRNDGHTILEAVHRQLAHYAYHIGQIVYLGRMRKGHQWQSLSIPKAQSKKYNQHKADQSKSKRHFTDEWFDKNQ